VVVIRSLWSTEWQNRDAYNIAPILFGIVIACMIYDTFKELDTGIRVNYRSDGGVFNVRLLQAKTKVSCMLVRELIFTDDCALAAHSEEDA